MGFCFLNASYCQSVLSKHHVQKVLKKFTADTLLKPASISFSLMDLNSGKVLASFNEHKALIPASSQKIISCAMALDALSPQFTYHTPFLLVGDTIVDGVFFGNLEIIGSGDPSFGSEYMSGTPDLQSISDTLYHIFKEKGIRSVQGKIIINPSYIRDLPENKEWLLYDLGNYYGAGCYSFNYAENLARISLAASSQDNTYCQIVRVEPEELKSFYTSKVVGRTQQLENEVYVIGFSQSCQQEVYGEWKCCSDDTLTIRSAVANPSEVFTKLLRESLFNKGISFNEQTPVVSGNSELIYSHYSTSLNQLVYRALTKSVNLYCESFVHEIGRHFTGSTERQASLNLMNTQMRLLMQEGETLLMEDGSGLSPKNLVSSSAFIKILQWIQSKKNLSNFWENLPDIKLQGALAKYFNPDKKSHFQLKLKSGSMERVRSYSGFIVLNDKPVYAISLIVNFYTCNGDKVNSLIASMFSELINMK